MIKNEAQKRRSKTLILNHNAQNKMAQKFRLPIFRNLPLRYVTFRNISDSL